MLRRGGYWAFVWRRLRGDPTTLLLGVFALAILLSAVLAPVLAPFDPSQGSAFRRLAPIGTPQHVLGTDELGRDMLSRLLHGGRTSLLLGIAPVAFALMIGGSLGLLAG